MERKQPDVFKRFYALEEERPGIKDDAHSTFGAYRETLYLIHHEVKFMLSVSILKGLGQVIVEEGVCPGISEALESEHVSILNHAFALMTYARAKKTPPMKGHVETAARELYAQLMLKDAESKKFQQLFRRLLQELDMFKHLNSFFRVKDRLVDYTAVKVEIVDTVCKIIRQWFALYPEQKQRFDIHFIPRDDKEDRCRR